MEWKGKPPHPKYPDLVDLFTLETERGNGFGTMLIAYCERLAKDKGFNKIELAVNPDLNSNAYKLYLNLGFIHDQKDKT